MNALSDFLQRHMLRCPSVALLHMQCPGCGMQRSLVGLLRGDLTESLRLHPATIPMLFLVLFAVAHLLFRFRYGARIIIAAQLTVGSLSIGFYVYKIISHQIHTT